MKAIFRILSAFMVIAFLSSCDAGVNPGDEVGLAAGFKHAASTFSYWISLVVVLVLASTAIFFYLKAVDKGKVEFNGWLGLVLVAAILFAILFRPLELGRNTTVEQAERDQWIGY